MSNPVFSGDVFNAYAENDRMTASGVVVKSLLLLAIVCGVAYYTGQDTALALKQYEPAVIKEEGKVRDVDISHIPGHTWQYLVVGSLGGLFVALITVFSPKTSMITAPIYAGLEGAAIGSISAIFNYMYPGIVMETIAATGFVFISFLFLYQMGIIQVTETFSTVVITATVGLAIFYLGSLILMAFGVNNFLLDDASWMGIGFSIFASGLAAFNLALDFDNIEKGIGKSPKYMEMYCAFGLMVTLIWLYLELLKLIAKLKSND